MKQYNAVKTKHPDAMVLFRVGDFYETFGEDAIKAARILNIVLTNRNNGSERTELAGFPHHSLESYLPKLVKAGERVAICDQLEDPKQTKKIVKRGITEVVTPGVALNDDVLQGKSNNFLAAVARQKNQLGIAFIDISTGEFLCAEGNEEQLEKLLQNFQPSELLLSKGDKKTVLTGSQDQYNPYILDDWLFTLDYAEETLLKHFQTNNLKGFGVDHLDAGLIAAGAIMHYLQEINHDKLAHITKLSPIADDQYVWMDGFTVANLELFRTTQPEGNCLLDIIDRCVTNMGSRLLKRWLAMPLKSMDLLKQRHQTVDHLVKTPQLLDELRYQLKSMGDIERLSSKLATRKISPREVLQLAKSIEALAPIQDQLQATDCEPLQTTAEKINRCEIMLKKIREAVHEDAPVNIAKGKVIADGYSQELDEWREMAYSGQSYIDDMLRRESERTGIPSLKIASNNVFGYYIEVRNTHKNKVPEDWTRKQTLVNAERYITDELKEYEAKIVHAQEKLQVLEQELFEEIINWLSQYISTLQQNAYIVSRLDCLCGFAELARKENYAQPDLNDGFNLMIKDGRHPVIEKQLPEDEDYIANDIYLDRENQQVIMITGPNMSGKSALLRQTALITIMAQIGSFVPAKEAHLGITDKIFTRVGASDNISMGESTFMVEMNETASILNNMSERSLILLDEIGRGTSTYDGISIAWAISEFLHEHPTRPKTLFATHYHELNEMTERFERIKNYNVTVKAIKDKVIFLRKLEQGGSRHSFGIHVAKMAGMPHFVINRSEQILSKLEKDHQEDDQENVKDATLKDTQLSIFQLDDPRLEEIKSELMAIDVEEFTPIEALMKLNQIKKKLISKEEERSRT
ncbi:MAG: DNA mismatch repair protein MutS [Psychroflexus sp.]|nr:DNA mismatch repair protein MutS [Psychroflexus sp.]MDR9448050.1 DNA mismatch repair protein MutS [Psychroflexus sp.]